MDIFRDWLAESAEADNTQGLSQYARELTIQANQASEAEPVEESQIVWAEGLLERLREHALTAAVQSDKAADSFDLDAARAHEAAAKNHRECYDDHCQMARVHTGFMPGSGQRAKKLQLELDPSRNDAYQLHINAALAHAEAASSHRLVAKKWRGK